jgi:hypothetical protein
MYRLYIQPPITSVVIYDIWKVRHTTTLGGETNYTTIYTVGQGTYIFDTYMEIDIEKSYNIKCVYYKNPYYYHLLGYCEVL